MTGALCKCLLVPHSFKLLVKCNCPDFGLDQELLVGQTLQVATCVELGGLVLCCPCIALVRGHTCKVLSVVELLGFEIEEADSRLEETKNESLLVLVQHVCVRHDGKSLDFLAGDLERIKWLFSFRSIEIHLDNQAVDVNYKEDVSSEVEHF